MLSRPLLSSSCLRALPTRTIFRKSTPVYNYSEKDEKFLRFIDLDAKYLSQIPWVFKPIEPYIHMIRDSIFQMNQYVGLPWWVIVVLTSILCRITIFPLIFVQMKKMSRIGPVFPIFVHIKEAWRTSNLPISKKIELAWNMYRKLAKQQNFRLRSVFVYNLAYYPLLISMIFSLRSLLSIDAVAKSGFLYLNNLADIDPFYILPTLTVACYYWNFQRFITPENKDTIASRIRTVCQVFLIMWYPFLCCWPSGIVLYMFCNALISVLQASLTKSVWFQSKLNPKVMHYNQMLVTVEYDKKISDSIVQAIKTGEQSLKQKSIKQQVLLQQTQKMIKQLNKQLQDEKKGKFRVEDEVEADEQKQKQKSSPVKLLADKDKDKDKSNKIRQKQQQVLPKYSKQVQKRKKNQIKK